MTKLKLYLGLSLSGRRDTLQIILYQLSHPALITYFALVMYFNTQYSSHVQICAQRLTCHMNKQVAQGLKLYTELWKATCWSLLVTSPSRVWGTLYQRMIYISGSRWKHRARSNSTNPQAILPAKRDEIYSNPVNVLNGQVRDSRGI